MSDEIERLCERLEDGQVCSAPENWCRNNPVMQEAAAALRALQAENEQTLAMLRAEWDVIDSAWKARAEAAEAALVEARAAAFEEAAKVAETHKPTLSLLTGSGPNGYWRGVEENSYSIATAIRALAHGEKG